MFAISRNENGVTGCSQQNQCSLRCDYEDAICNNDEENFECGCEDGFELDVDDGCSCPSGYEVRNEQVLQYGH